MKTVSGYFFFILVNVVVVACPQSLEAQDSIRRNAWVFSAGATIPYGDFAASTFTPMAGFAKPGVDLNLEILHFGRRGILGVYANAGYTNVFFDRKNYLAEYVKIIGDEGITSVTTGNYQFLNAEGGFLLRWVMFPDTRIILHAGIGYSLCLHPYLAAENTYWGVLNTVNRDMDFQVSSTTGIRMEHSLDQRTGIQLAWSVTACKPSFTDAEGLRNYGYVVPVRMQHINIGITRYF